MLICGANDVIGVGQYGVPSCGYFPLLVLLRYRSGTGTAGTGTGKITFDGATSANIESGPSNNFHHFEINTTSDKTVITNGLDIDGDFTIIQGTFNPGAFSHDIAGNWDDSGGSFTGGTGTVTMSASSSAIKAGKDNKFNNLIVSGTDTINSDFAVEIGGDLTVSGTSCVSTTDLFVSLAGGNGSGGNAFNLINTSGADLYIDGFSQGPAFPILIPAQTLLIETETHQTAFATAKTPRSYHCIIAQTQPSRTAPARPLRFVLARCGV